MGSLEPIKGGPARALYLGVCSAHTNSSSLNFSLREKNSARAVLKPRGLFRGACSLREGSKLALVPRPLLALGRRTGATEPAYSPLSRGLELYWFCCSSQRFSNTTRSRDCCVIASSIASITGSQPSSKLVSRAVKVSMRCRRRCVRLQRGASGGRFGSGETGQSFEEVIRLSHCGQGAGRRNGLDRCSTRWGRRSTR